MFANTNVGFHSRFQSVLRVLLVCLFVCGISCVAHAATVYVANDGVDSGVCGDSGNPCRSISQGIANASEGDTISVGPGRYGDLNNNGDFSDAGDEAAEDGFGCNCLIKIAKRVTVHSRNGAYSTTLDAGGIGIHTVRIQTNKVVFGAKAKGFTVTGGDSGLFVESDTIDVIVTANLAAGNENDGFHVLGKKHIVEGNIATSNGGDGFHVNGTNCVVNGGMSQANSGDGYHILGEDQKVEGSLAVGNFGDGVQLGGTAHTVTGNSILGNFSYGVLLVTGGTTATVTKNNIYGNNEEDNGDTNCGFKNRSGGTINAKDNFWGAPNGPGIQPADQACDEGVGSSTDVTPVATKEIKVKVKPAL